MGEAFAFLNGANDRVLFYLDQPYEDFSNEQSAYD